MLILQCKEEDTILITATTLTKPGDRLRVIIKKASNRRSQLGVQGERELFAVELISNTKKRKAS